MRDAGRLLEFALAGWIVLVMGSWIGVVAGKPAPEAGGWIWLIIAAICLAWGAWRGIDFIRRRFGA